MKRNERYNFLDVVLISIFTSVMLSLFLTGTLSYAFYTFAKETILVIVKILKTVSIFLYRCLTIEK